MQWCIIYLNFFGYMEKILYSLHSCQRHLKRVSNKYLRSSNSQDHEVIKHYMQLMNIHKYIYIYIYIDIREQRQYPWIMAHPYKGAYANLDVEKNGETPNPQK